MTRYVLFILIIACLSRCTSPPPRSAAPALQVLQTPTELSVTLDGKPVLTYRVSDTLPPGLPEYYRRSGFLYPVYTPGGYVLNDAFPVGHAHQHGIFMAWTKTVFRGDTIDFWNQQKETGTVTHREVLETSENGATAGFRVKLQHLSLAHGPVLDEEWYVRVHNDTDPYRWELQSTQTNITGDTLFLLPHLYGGLGVRGSREWNPADSLHFITPARFLTSEGLDRPPANHTRPEWTAIYGDAGYLKVTPSPDNFRAPQYVRVHPEMPYLSVTPIVEEGFFIAPGATYRSTYTFGVGTTLPLR